MDSLMKLISRTHRCANSYRSEKLSGEGLNGCQHIYIFQVCKEPGITQEQLAGRIFVNKSNVTRQVGALEQRGFLERRPDPEDRRVLRVYPTEKGEEMFPQVQALMKEWNRLLLEDFSEEERASLFAMLQRVMDKAVAVVEGMSEKDGV